MNKLRNFARLIRPRQWIKNLAIFAAIIFNGQLFEQTVFEKVFLGFIVFCLVSSAIYIINDIFDIEKDKQHPFKKFRPLAHGDIPLPLAIITAIFFTILALIIGSFVTPAFLLLITIYFILQVSYSVILKHIAVIDILALAAGYILRVYGGEFASGFHISVWLLLTTISLSLFLAVGKRRSELTLISKQKDSHIELVRKSLSHYSERLLDVYTSIFATSTFISYALFTFLESPRGFNISLDVLLSDKPLFITVALWSILVIGIIYFIKT